MSGKRRKGGAARQSPTPDTRHPTPRAALTLVELLITILIIGILAAAVLGVAAVANQSARESRTRIMIARLHTLVNEQYDTYKSRRVKVRKDITDWINGLPDATYTPAQKNQLKFAARLYATRELMLTEIPDRWSDVLLRDVPDPPNSSGVAGQAMPTFYFDAPLVNDPPHTPKTARTELGNIYLRAFRRIANATNKTSGTTNSREQVLQNQGAELLYLYVTNACGDGEARSLFPESMIGDSDGDSALEFLDGWGRPIEFLRWAPGFNSEIQLNMIALAAMAPDEANRAVGSNRDPFDIFRADLLAFRLVPLIYSVGQDGETGIYTEPAAVTWRPTSVALSIGGATEYPRLRPRLSPYVIGGSFPSPTDFFGTAIDRTAAVDNIHNHLISMKPKR